MVKLDPYSDIQKRPLNYEDGMRSSGYGIRIHNPNSEDLWDEIGQVSSNYLVVPNKNVKEMAEDIINDTDWEWEEGKNFWNGRQYMVSYNVINHNFGQVNVDDPLTVGMGMWNSYDGSRALSWFMFVVRLACTNGMTSRSLFPMYRFKHDNVHENWKDELSNVSKILTNAQRPVNEFIDCAQNLENRRLTMRELKTIRNEYIRDIPHSKFGKVMDKYLSNGNDTAWDFLNAATHTFWHNEKQTKTDFDHNDYVVTRMLDYAQN
tara:strand:- start:21 stop:809 length:789 start_codon:yes stop_codon:yes gene_type:complete